MRGRWSFSLWLGSWAALLWSRVYRLYDRTALALGPSPFRRWGRGRGE